VPPDNDHDDRAGDLLHLLQKELETRGLLPTLVSGQGDGQERCARLAVTNPAAPDRGVIYVEDSGCLIWERPASLQDPDVAEIAAQAASILQHAGSRRGPRRPAWSDGSASSLGRSELIGTRQQQLVFLNTHWGRYYVFSAPRAPDDQWTATARFGRRQEIQRWSAGQLLAEVRRHYHREKQSNGS
jgi:hypothetical protein